MQMISVHNDCWPKVWQQNKALFDDMIFKQNCKFQEGKNTASFIDIDGKYVSFPVGYITYNFYPADRGTPYISVQGKNGWLQKSSKNHQELLQWAIETSSKLKGN
jgi:hypothetical protein